MVGAFVFQLRETQAVSVFPVGQVSETGVATPVVQGGKVVDFLNPFGGGLSINMVSCNMHVYTYLVQRTPACSSPKYSSALVSSPHADSSREFQVDWAGFAVSTAYWRDRGAPSLGARQGQVENIFLQELGVSMTDLEPLAEQCTQVYSAQSWGGGGRGVEVRAPLSPSLCVVHAILLYG